MDWRKIENATHNKYVPIYVLLLFVDCLFSQVA